MFLKTMTFFILIICLIKYLSAEDNEGILCSAKTCSDYISANPCASLPDNCNIQNGTHNGLFLPSPDPCNCCSYCLENLNENDYCAQGEIGGLIPDSICGPGLSCSGGVCVKMSEIVSPPPCSEAQAGYDKRRQDGTLGSTEIRPVCDDDGYFAPYKCVNGQTCFCVNKDGTRIFGEIPYSSTAHLILKCECPRKYYDILKFVDKESLYPNQHFRCTSTGDYDTIQCIGEDCMCTDAADGAPTFPTQATVNIDKISSSTLPDCFNAEVHLTDNYFYACAQKLVNIIKEIQEYKDEGYDAVFSIDFPKCDLDGKYTSVQESVDAAQNVYYYCVHSDGTPIESSPGVPYQATSETSIDCNCARSLLLIPEDAFEKPQCCLSGNFNRVQCRLGKCYCVDSDGYQDVNNTDADKKTEVNIDEKDQLFCYDPVEQEACLGTS